MDCAVNICVIVLGAQKQNEIKIASGIAQFAFRNACCHKMNDKVSFRAGCNKLTEMDNIENDYRFQKFFHNVWFLRNAQLCSTT